MQKICLLILLLSALASNYEAVPQTKWSRPIRNPQGQLTRERRQFPFGEWVPLSQPCPTCRPFSDPLDAGLGGGGIGLTPPRPPTVTRQIHGEGNFFPQDESSILSVPPPSAIPRHPVPGGNGNFQFSNFGQQFNKPLPVPTQKIFPQTQQIQFLPQTQFLPNQPLLVNGNHQQILPGLNAQNNLFGHEQNQQQVNGGKVAGFNSEFKSQKIPENVVLEQNKRPVAPKQAFSNKPQPFTPQQQNQQTFVKQQVFNGQQQQIFNGQQQHSVNFENSILTPPPAPKNVTQDIVIPGLDKEEIQLLYVPVETLRQRGTPQEQLLTQQPQNIQFYNRQNGLQRPVNNVRPTEQAIVSQPKGHFITQNGNSQGQADSSLKVTSTQTFPTTVTPSTLLLQHLPFQTPQPFVSATPATPTIQSFVTPASVFQKFSPFTPETTLPHLSTVPNTIQFTQSDLEFGTTPKTIASQGVFTEEIITGKPQFTGLKSAGLSQEQEFPGKQQGVTQQPQLSTVFSQEQQKELITPTHFPHQIDQQQINLQKQQEHQRILQQQRQKELEEQRFLEQQRKQKELEEQRILQQQQQQRQKELEQQRFLQKQKELEEQRQKELEQQRFLQKQKELEEQRLLQQRRQKELEQQRLLQKQKEIEEQRRQKELEQQRFLQKQKELEEQRLLQQRQKELQEQRFLQEQRQRELENQRRLQLQKQKELEEKRRLQLKQKEDEARLLRFQQQQKELEQQRLLQQQQEEQQRQLEQQKLQKQKQENLRKQQQFQLFQQQQQQQQQQQLQQHLQQQNQNLPQQGSRHVLPANDNLNFIPELEKESEQEDQQLVPHQPPLSVFFKGHNGAEVKITDVLRELRGSKTITVLDQYFEKMPTVFVGPAGLIPPTGYGKFELPYLSNLESNRIERRIDKLPFFVAPLNFVPPPGYAKIPFPAPHVGSVVVSSETNPAMNLKSAEKGSSSEEDSGSFPVVGPELPGLINNLDTVTTTIKPTTYTPSLPQTTAQLRNRRPNNSIYKPQSRKPITRTRPTTTSRPEEEVTQPIQKAEVTKEPEGVFRKPFNRFLNRRRQQQAKTTTEIPIKSQQDGKSLENRHYSVDSYGQEKNQVPRTQQKSDVIHEKAIDDQFNRQFEHHPSDIDRITPGDQGAFEARPTPDFSKASHFESEERRPDVSDYADVNLQSYEDGPVPTGSAKTITHELYRPNAINRAEEEHSKTLSKPDSTQSSVLFQPSAYDGTAPTKFSEISDASPTVGLVDYKDTEGQVSVEPTSIVGYEKQDVTSERVDTTEVPKNKVSYTTDPASGEQHTQGYFDSNEQYTSAFAEISKPHHIPGFVDSSKRQHSNAYPTPAISVDLEAPFAQTQQSQGYDASSELRPTGSAEVPENKFAPTASSNEQFFTGLESDTKNQQSFDVSTSQVSPTAPGATEVQYTTDFSANSQSSAENGRQYEDQRIGSFISVQDVHSTATPQQHYPSSSAFPSQATPTGSEYPITGPVSGAEQNPPQVSSTAEAVTEATASPTQTYTSAPEGLLNVSEQTTEGHGQGVADSLPNDHRLKLPNPSIVRVRTRVRGRPRGQVNFAASQSTTQAPFIRSTVESRHHEHTEEEHTTRINHFREYNPVKTSKYNQFRGVKKPIRTTTETPTTTEHEHRANIYTVRPHRRPLNPSTVSTKRIRRPTTPLPSAETATEAFGVSTVESYSPSEHASDISPSGVSNDVYYEQSSLSPVKHKFRKHFGAAEQKNDVVPAYVSTAYPSVSPTYSTLDQEAYSEESHFGKDLTHTEGSVEDSAKFPEWSPSESGFDVLGIVLTTARTPGQEEKQVDDQEEPKKTQDVKKAFDPDLEKKTGRRRVRVRVHKRPHENFETAESQNLRTVANVLVPPTTTYKPNDESSFHQLAKNADFSFGGQKLFGIRSREYFRKRLNLTQEGVPTAGSGTSENVTPAGETTEKPTAAKISSFLRKAQRNDFESAQSNETTEGGKVVRPKFRGFVRKIIKHGGTSKEVDPEPNQLTEKEEKHESGELHSRQQFRVNQAGFNHTGKVNGTRHKTFVRYVKKNKIRHHEIESQQESSSEEAQKEEQGLHQTTESHTEGPQSTESRVTEGFQSTESRATEGLQSTESRTTENVKEEAQTESQFPVYHGTEQTQNVQPQEHETTQESHPREEEEERHSSSEPEQPSSTQATPTESAEAYESSSHVTQEISTPQPSTPQTHLAGLYLTQRPKFYQTLRPVFPRTNGFQRTKEPEPETRSSTTEQSVKEPQEKRNGFTRFKYGKTSGYGSTASEKSDETKKINEQQLKNKNLHTLEVRKYLRTKIREGGFSQFSKNKYSTSERTETVATVKDQESEPEEITTERAVETTSVEPKTTQAVAARTDPVEIENETTKNEDPELHVTTTEAPASSEEEEEEEEEEESSEEDLTSPATFETTTETEIPTTAYKAPTSPETPAATESKTTIQTTESVEPQQTEYEPDIYRFSKNSFSFDEAEQFTGTQNRAHVRNITTDIIENTASFSAPGVEKRPEIRVVTHRSDEGFPPATESQDTTQNEKTEATTTTELNGLEATTTEAAATDYPETTETGTTASTAAVTKAKLAKIFKTSTTTKISHETEICYRGKCIRTKSDNPDEDLKLLVDSASTMKIGKAKRGT